MKDKRDDFGQRPADTAAPREKAEDIARAMDPPPSSAPSPEELLHLSFQDITPEKWHAAQALLAERSAQKVEALEARVRDFLVMQKELEESREHLRITLDSIGDAVIVTDTRGVIGSLNPVAAKLTGWDATRAVGRPLDEVLNIVNAQTSLKTDNPVRKALAAGTVVGLAKHTVLVSLSGERRHIADSAAPIFGADGAVKGVALVFRDVTEEYRIHQELRQQRSFLRLLIDQTPNQIFWKDRDLRYLGCNQMFATVAGVGIPEKVVGMTDYDFQRSQADTEAYRTHDRKIIESGEPILGLEEHYFTADGQEGYVLTNKVPIRDADNEIIGVLGTCTDITDRTRAEGALRESEANFRLFFESMTDIIVVATPEGRVLFTNRAAREKLGYSADELASTHLLDWHRPEDREEAEAVFAEMLRGERDYCPLPLMAKDGGILPVETRVWFGKWSGLDCVFGVCKDLSAEREAQQRFERIFRSNPSPMALTSIPDQRFMDVNDAFVETTGYTRAEIVGKTIAELGLAANPEAQSSVAATLRAEGRGVNHELQVRRKDGSLRDGIFSGEVIHSQGREIFLTVMVDITERKRMERQLREREQRLALALETARLGYWRWTPATGQVEWFGDHHKLFGIRQEDFEGTLDGVQRCVHPDDRRMGFNNIHRAVETKTPFDNTYRVVHPDGSIRWLNSFGHLCHDEQDRAEFMFGITRDISEYKFAQDEAEERVAQLTALLNSMQRGVLVEDTKRRIVFANQDFCNFFGLPNPETILGADCKEAARASASLFAAPQAFLKSVEDCLAGGEPVPNERLEMTDGRILERTYAPVIMKERQFGHLWLYRDKTEQLRVEGEIARAKQEWERTFDAVPDMICILDKNHRILRANRAFAERFERSPEEIVGETCHECVHHRSQPPDDCPHSKTLEDKAEHTVEISEPSLGGDVLVTTTPLTDASGDFIGSVHVARDVTERNAVETRLRIMGRMLDLAPSSITVHDAGGNFLYANRETFSMHGYDEKEFLSINLRDLDVPESETLIARRVQEIAEKGEALFEVAHYRKDGTAFPLEVLAKKVEWRGVPAILSIATDISERKKLEKERLEMERRLQHTQKLESLGILAGGIAHDFNNLLMAILGHADLALDVLTATSPARENIEQIETASRRAADLCAQMLAYSGRGRFIIKPFDVSALVNEMAHLLKTSISKKALLNLQIEQNLPKIEGDATQIRQVVMNLVINASEAIGERSGVIRVSTGTCHCQTADFQGAVFEGSPAEGLYVCVEVADTGCGMDQATLDRLFEPFFTTKFTGRGLGMSAVLGIVRGHKGVLKVHSEPGRGTTFRVLLPPSAAQDKDGPALPDRDPGCSRKSVGRILLVDDEESIRALGRKMLERIGFKVATAADGREALALYEREGNTIDLVVLDLTMPHMDGEETLRALKRMDPEVGIVMASGYSNYDVQARLAGEGLLGFIQKPYTMAQLKECLYPLSTKWNDPRLEDK
jgi:PAS domain S-box-containing protein